MASSAAMLDVRDLTIAYPSMARRALDCVNLHVCAGELVIVLGSNGSGKSTLMRSIVRLLEPQSGSIVVDGKNIAHLRGHQLREARCSLAMVFQHPNLVRRRSVLANVAAGTLGRHRDWRSTLGGSPAAEIAHAEQQLAAVGLSHLAEQRAGTLSGGQGQRVAIARALAQRPNVLLADEPVASLDPEAAGDILALLRRLATQERLAVLCVLHQPELAMKYADRLIGMRDGRIAFDRPTTSVTAPMVGALYLAKPAA